MTRDRKRLRLAEATERLGDAGEDTRSIEDATVEYEWAVSLTWITEHGEPKHSYQAGTYSAYEWEDRADMRANIIRMAATGAGVKLVELLSILVLFMDFQPNRPACDF